MKISVTDIPHDGLSLHFEEETDSVNDLFKKDGRDVNIIAPVDFTLLLKQEADAVYVKGSIKTRLSLLCSLCAKRFNYGFQCDMEYVLSKKARMPVQEDLELETDELEIGFLKDETIDTQDILSEQLYLELPIKPLCSGGCRGLCSKCGADLNIDECACNRDDIVDPRFAKLKELKL